MKSVLRNLRSERERERDYIDIKGNQFCVLGSWKRGWKRQGRRTGSFKKQRKSAAWMNMEGDAPLFLSSCVLCVERLEARRTGLLMKTVCGTIWILY